MYLLGNYYKLPIITLLEYFEYPKNLSYYLIIIKLRNSVLTETICNKIKELFFNCSQKYVILTVTVSPFMSVPIDLWIHNLTV
jgi:hypothetical protein